MRRMAPTTRRWFTVPSARGPVLGALLTGVVLLCAIVLVRGSGPESFDSRLDQVRERGSLIMLTRNGASSYFIDGGGPTGPEYALAQRFAERLGVDVEVRVAEAYDELAELLKAGEGDLIAANLSRTANRERQFRFALPYAETHTLVVVRKGLREPAAVKDLQGLRGVVLAGSSYEEWLAEAGADLALEWEARTGVGVEDLLHEVAEGHYEYTLVDERIFQLHERYHPGVRQAFTAGGDQPLAWAFPRDDDDSLVQAADLFLREARENGTLAAIDRQFFTPEEPLDQVDMIHFQARMRDRLPHYLPFFQEAANRHELDWRLLAAVGYQESHWDPRATSPTGVRGVMMLTRNTARSLGVDDRLDPCRASVAAPSTSCACASACPSASRSLTAAGWRSPPTTSAWVTWKTPGA